MQILTVVNRMLATMGEAPLASLEEPHTFRGSCQTTLTQEDRLVQARGWWYNKETMTLAPQVNGRISLAGDAISVRTEDPAYVQRGRYLYDLGGNGYTFTSSVAVTLIRLVPFEELPESAAGYIAACAVRKFQLNIDGDTHKQQALAADEARAYAMFHTEHIRNSRVNLLESNTTLARIKATINGARRYIR